MEVQSNHYLAETGRDFSPGRIHIRIPTHFRKIKFSKGTVRSMRNLYLHSKPLKLHSCCLYSRNQVNTETLDKNTPMNAKVGDYDS